MTIDREQQARAREVLDALPFERFPDRDVRWYSRKTVLEALIAFADEARLAERGEWSLIETAPHAMHVMAARFDNDAGEWIYSVVLSPPSKPFTHWRLLPEPPIATAIRTPNEGEVS